MFSFVQHQMIGKRLKDAGMRRCNMEMQANRAQQGPAIWTPPPHSNSATRSLQQGPMACPARDMEARLNRPDWI